MSIREQNLNNLCHELFDVVIVGAGINGAVTANALAARGVRVALIDKRDFAGNTSSNSSNLIWGGIKYLENHEYGLVNKLCKSRNRLMTAFPSTVKETRFLATVIKGFRFPGIFMYFGTLLYWAFGRFKTQAPKYLTAKRIKQRESIINIEQASGGFEYSDCHITDGDARFVWGFVRKFLKLGGVAVNYIESQDAQRIDDTWTLTAQDLTTGQTLRIRSKVLINACGPEVDAFNQKTQHQTKNHHAFSKGIHLIVNRLSNDRRVLTFFASDGRMFFMTPMGSRSCIGTTDTRLDSPDGQVTDQDRQFILDNANEMLQLAQPLTLKDIISERCGVRPLAVETNDQQSDWLQMSRKHILEVDIHSKQASIFGGKLTDCINVGEEMVDIVESLGINTQSLKHQWYGEPGKADKKSFFAYAQTIDLDQYTNPKSHEPLSMRLWRRYGNQATALADCITKNPDNASLMFDGSDFTVCELEYAAQNEMIVTLEDFLRRRSDIASVVSSQEILKSESIHMICQRLFGLQADQKLQHYYKNLQLNDPKNLPTTGQVANR